MTLRLSKLICFVFGHRDELCVRSDHGFYDIERRCTTCGDISYSATVSNPVQSTRQITAKELN